MEPLINVEQAAWMIQGAASILVAGHDADNRPSLAHALGCRVSADRRTLVALLPMPQAEELLRDLGNNGDVAITFTNSRSTRSIQLKAHGAREVPVEPGDSERVSSHCGGLIREWSSVGLPEANARAMLWRGDRLVAVEIVAHVAFDQTPGPRAGTTLPSS